MSHDAFSQYDAAYVLGALSPADRQAYEDHLGACGSCRRAVSEVAGLPGLLARVHPRELEPEGNEPEGNEPGGDEPGGDEPGSGPVPDTLLPRLLAEVRRAQRRRRTWAGLTAAAALLAVTSVGVGVAERGGTSPEAVPPTGRTMTQVHQDQLSASLAMETVAWGTRLSITCTYTRDSYGNEPLPSYALVVHTRDGRAQQVATWRAVAGKPTTVIAATASRPAEISSVEVRTTRGEPVLRLNG